MADTPHPSSVAGGPYDGVTFPYIPKATLQIDPKLSLHTDWTDKIDPITYEVVRHNLWTVNEELGMTIQRISGSPLAVYAFDLNSSIFTEDGEFIYYGPYQLYMSGVSDVQVKWTLEHRSGNPGIREGEMFLSNDPWVGGAHQMDVTLLNPVFSEGKLFCWITNVLHQYDVGGITPGSFCPNARDAFDEGILLPPVKIVEGGELRKDIEAVYLRASRKPYLVALDLRAQIAGNVTAARRITQLIERYGAARVKGLQPKDTHPAECAGRPRSSRRSPSCPTASSASGATSRWRGSATAGRIPCCSRWKSAATRSSSTTPAPRPRWAPSTPRTPAGAARS